MHAFLATINFRYQVLAITDSGDIWRMWFDGTNPLLQRLTGDEPEYYNAIRLLRAKKDLYA